MSYPEDPGFKKQAGGETTSRDAAALVKHSAKRQADLVIDALTLHGKATTVEIAEALRESKTPVLHNSVRARCSDLALKQVIRPSGSYGLGESRKARAIRWEINPDYKPPAPQTDAPQIGGDA